MGANQIERGSKRSLDDLERRHGAAAGGDAGRPAAGAAAAAAGAAARRRRRGGGAGGGRDAPRRRRPRRGGLAMATYNSVLKDPARRDPRAYVIPADQADSPTATKFINTLRYIGVEIQQATAPLTVGGKTYPKGSYVVKTAQAGRAHVHRHVRAPGSPQRHGRARHPAPAVRQRRLDALLPDGREVRPVLGRRDRPAAGDRGPGGSDPGHDHRHRERDRGLPAVAVDQRLLHHRQPRA